MVDLATRLGPLSLRSPLVAACGTVGSVVDFAAVGALEAYGAAVAKSVSGEPRRTPGRKQCSWMMKGCRDLEAVEAVRLTSAACRGGKSLGSGTSPVSQYAHMP